MEPWSDSYLWRKAVQAPVEAGDVAARNLLLALLQPAQGGIMWRTAKESVAHELGLPPQVSTVTRLQLSAVERHAYRRCHKETADDALLVLPASVINAVRSGKAVPAEAERPLTTKEGKGLIERLRKLRQVCLPPAPCQPCPP